MFGSRKTANSICKKYYLIFISSYTLFRVRKLLKNHFFEHKLCSCLILNQNKFNNDTGLWPGIWSKVGMK